MEAIIVAGLSAGALTVILCTAEIAEPLRRWIKYPLHCPFCTSYWASLLFDPSMTVLATMAVANIAILLIHWSMSTYEQETSEGEAETSTGQEV